MDYKMNQRGPTHGKPDYVLSHPSAGGSSERPNRVMLEYKSSHNLTLPPMAHDVERRYKNGIAVERTNAGESLGDYCRVCEAPAQLFGYMKANSCRFGVLTSASRSYFFRVVGSGQVEVSDAWFVGQENYLSAWAYLYSQSLGNEDFPSEAVAREWQPERNTNKGRTETNPSAQAPATRTRGKRGSSGDSGRSSSSKAPKTSIGRQSNHRHAVPNRDSDVPFSRINATPIESVKFGDALGFGRNGCVFRALWNGKEVAVKQFDLGKDGGMENFCREVEAYELLRDAHGILVPKALFLTESEGRGIKYLGLQLGRDPTSEDCNAFHAQSWRDILHALKTQYGFVHDDADGRNGLFVPDGRGGEKLVAMDLEMHSLTEKGRRLLDRIKVVAEEA